MNSETLKNKLKPIVYPIINFIPRRRLKNKNFTIICDNCWAGKVYQELGLPYQTPFVGMFVFSPDYIKMLKNLKYYLSGNIPLIFIKESKYIFKFRTIECPEFELVESFYVIPNKLVFGEELSIQEIEEATKNKFYWEYVKSTFLKKFKKEKWTLGFIRHKFRMKRG
ncbi:DUF1919 domain-containing protein [Streptococcus macedonicus]|uniref:DUF1919 domain-containing protein n=1 Tax=Streptococcus macedonicus TaxID=59310 RepID=UPI00202A3397|nr:DUF1919 domain-containing protein [Streptococcus macedonicus]